MKTTQKLCRTFFDQVDSNKNGYMTLDEWAIACAQQGKPDPVASFMNVCTSCDGDDNYQITWEEYWKFCQETYEITG